MSDDEKNLQKYLNIPVSPVTRAIIDALTCSAGDLAAREPGRVNHDLKETLEQGPRGGYTYTRETRRSLIRLELADLERSNATARKILNLALSKISIDKETGRPARDCVEISLHELLELGIYKNIRAARKGFIPCMFQIESIKFSGVVKMGPDMTRARVSKEAGCLFYHANLKNSTCKIYPNPLLDWRVVAAFFTILPTSYFSMSARAADLLYTVVFLARQNTGKIVAGGGFSISMRAVQAALNLPSINPKNPRYTREPCGSIKRKIMQAAEEVNTNTADIEIGIHFAGRSIDDFLAGYIRVKFGDEYREKFAKIDSARTKKRRKK